MTKCYNTSVASVTLAAGSTASPYYLMANLTRRLCKPTCADNPPVFAPTFGVIGVSAVGSGQYVATVRIQGVISYDPCGTTCCSMSEPVSQTMTIPFSSATAPTSVTVTAGTTVNSIAVNGCQQCGRTFVSETPLTLTVA